MTKRPARASPPQREPQCLPRLGHCPSALTPTILVRCCACSADACRVALPDRRFKRGELWVAGKYDVLAVAARAIRRIGPWYASRVLAEGQSTSRHGRAV